MATEFYGHCNCEKRALGNADDFSAIRIGMENATSFPFALMFFELHTVRWCVVVNSAGGMVQLKYGDQ